jgi:hypothetical protein
MITTKYLRLATVGLTSLLMCSVALAPRSRMRKELFYPASLT